MKVVLFCGGEGLRLPGIPDVLPKPMTRIGYRPILWHVMRYYAHYGHSDRALLGYRADVIKDYFLHYDEAVSNDFVLSPGRGEHLRTDIADWRITFADTGARTSSGSACCGSQPPRGRGHVPGQLRRRGHRRAAGRDRRGVPGGGKVAGLIAARPAYSFHVVRADATARSPTSRTPTTPASGSTAATTCSGARSSTTSAATRTWSRSRSPARRGGPAGRVPARRVLRVDGHAQGPRDARVARGQGNPPGPLAGGRRPAL